MRWIAKDSERKPDPAPINGTVRTAVVIGLIGFALALIASIVFYEQITSPNKVWYPYTCVVGLVLGVFAWFKVGNR
jgi:NAD/NADP transhydrogenase beta subunit